MGSRAMSHDKDFLRVTAFFRDVSLHPGECRRDIFDLCREFVLRAKPVIEHGATKAKSTQLLADDGQVLAISGMPTAALGKYDGRESLRLGQVEIQLLPIITIGVSDIGFDFA